jgi:hypothetical protein
MHAHHQAPELLDDLSHAKPGLPSLGEQSLHLLALAFGLEAAAFCPKAALFGIQTALLGTSQALVRILGSLESIFGLDHRHR